MPKNKRRFYNKDGHSLYTVSRMTAREIAEQRKRQERTVQNWFKGKKG